FCPAHRPVRIGGLDRAEFAGRSDEQRTAAGMGAVELEDERFVFPREQAGRQNFVRGQIFPQRSQPFDLRDFFFDAPGQIRRGVEQSPAKAGSLRWLRRLAPRLETGRHRKGQSARRRHPSMFHSETPQAALAATPTDLARVQPAKGNDKPVRKFVRKPRRTE
ncbi:MAG: hypothetical protein UT63_C0053G0001, partial [Candidatus Gottesmanbacteria bacterium GW2011_GWC2_39_8]